MNFTTLVELLPKNAELKGFHPRKVQLVISSYNAWRENNTVDDYQLQVNLEQKINKLTIRVVEANEGHTLFSACAQGE